MDDLKKSLFESMKNSLRSGKFHYTKKNGKKIAPCGVKQRCKNNHKGECTEKEYCDRVYNCHEKAEMRLFDERVIMGEKVYHKQRGIKRNKQKKKIYEKVYLILGNLCMKCNEKYCYCSSEGYSKNCKHRSTDLIHMVLSKEALKKFLENGAE